MKWKRKANQPNEIRYKVSKGLFMDSNWFSLVHLEAGSNWRLNSSTKKKKRKKKVKAWKIHCWR